MAFKLIFIVFIGLLNLRFLFPCLLGLYQDINGNCNECSPGTLGRNCSDICPNGTYGLKCAYNCNCEDCDPVTGCLSNTTDASGTTFSVDISTALHPDTDESLVFYIVSSTLGFLLLFTLICCLSKRKKERPTEPDTNAENVSTGRSDNPEYTTLQFAGLRRYDGANIASASIYGVGQLGRDMPENGEYDMGLTLPTVDEMRQKVIEGETDSPSEMDIYSKDEDNPYMNFRRSEASPYDLADVSYAV